MLHKTPIRLKVSNRDNWVLPVYLLLVPAAMLSPYPVSLTLCAILFAGAEWFIRTLKYSKTSNTELISVIFPDGQVQLESGGEGSVRGFLEPQQWCTRWFAVLRFSDGDTRSSLVIRSSQQQGADDFRRLSVWLRQDLFSSTRARQVLDS